MALNGKCVVLGVTGGIAAYKACEIVSRLHKLGAEVRVVMTEHACEFVSPLTFETLSGNAVYIHQFERAFEIGHISLAKAADLMLVAPATANMIGKFASGVADDLLSTTLLAMNCPILIAPAMNSVMYRANATQDNLRILGERGVHFIGPDAGMLACGDDDIGRMSEPSTIAEEVARLLVPNPDFAGRRVLVTAGPTQEPLDPVRYLTNHSSGKMGYAIAEAARDRGASVILVSGPTNLPRPDGIEYIGILSTQDLFQTMTRLASDADVIIQAAAPADYRPKSVSKHKLKKTEEQDGLTLELLKNPDIAAALGREKRKGQTLVIFAAETDDLKKNAKAKLKNKNADLVVANDVTLPGAGFDVPTNIVMLIDHDSEIQLPRLTKREVADTILDRVSVLNS